MLLVLVLFPRSVVLLLHVEALVTLHLPHLDADTPGRPRPGARPRLRPAAPSPRPRLTGAHPPAKAAACGGGAERAGRGGPRQSPSCGGWPRAPAPRRSGAEPRSCHHHDLTWWRTPAPKRIAASSPRSSPERSARAAGTRAA